MSILRCTIFALAIGSLAGCGGGGGGEVESEVPKSSNELAQICAKESPYAVDALKPTTQGTLSDEKKWVKAFMSERYLWYRDMPAVNADDTKYNAFSSGVLNVGLSLYRYFSDLRTPLKTSAGNPVDRFSGMTTTAEWNGYAGGSGFGYGLMLNSRGDRPNQVLTIAYVYPNTPAETAGLARGDQILMVDGVSINDQNAASIAVEEGLYPTRQETHSFVVLRGNQSRTVQMSASVVQLQQAQHTVLTEGSKKVGYLLFNSHVPSAQTYLVNAINAFKEQSVTELVVDMRYNGGGYLSIARALASSVAGRAKAEGKVFEAIKFSDKRSAENEALYFSNVGMDDKVFPELGLSKVYVLASEGTCSASESFVNSLRGIDIDVELIGGTTCGKPYGFFPQDNCGITYGAMEFEGVNAKGVGGYADGMAPQCVVADDLTQALGDAKEGMLAMALRRIQGQSCSSPAALALSSKGLAGLSRQQEGRLVRPEWQTNKALTPK